MTNYAAEVEIEIETDIFNMNISPHSGEPVRIIRPSVAWPLIGQ